MPWVILALLCSTSVVIIYQDMTARAVSWVIFPILVILGIVYSRLYELTWGDIALNTTINTGFLAFQFLLLKVFYRMKRQTGTLGNKIGWGDILFLFSCCFFFSPLNFLVFYVFSLVFSLLAFLTYSFLFRKKNSPQTVPLAGLQSLFLLLFLTYNMIWQNDLSSDSWLLNKLIV